MRFQPGQSGNPAGRPPGSRNKRTIITEQLFGDGAGEVATAAIKSATEGDPAALRACLDRVAPKLRHRPIDFVLPDLVTLADTPVAFSAIARGLASGDLDVEGAAALRGVVRDFMLAQTAVERDKRAAAAPAEEDDASEEVESLADFMARANR